MSSGPKIWTPDLSKAEWILLFVDMGKEQTTKISYETQEHKTLANVVKIVVGTITIVEPMT